MKCILLLKSFNDRFKASRTIIKPATPDKMLGIKSTYAMSKVNVVYIKPQCEEHPHASFWYGGLCSRPLRRFIIRWKGYCIYIFVQDWATMPQFIQIGTKICALKWHSQLTIGQMMFQSGIRMDNASVKSLTLVPETLKSPPDFAKVTI